MKKTIKLLVVFLALACITAALFACAEEPAEAIKYTVTFANEDGTVLQSGEVEAGAIPEYKGETPTKESDEAYTYTFDGWDAELVAVTGEVTYTAKYVKVAREYTITFKNGDTVLWTGKLPYGATPSYTGTPEKAETDEYIFIFAGWDAEIVAVTGDATYNAKFTQIPAQQGYTVTYKNHDGTVLQTGLVVKGEEPEYKGAAPEKAGDVQYSYVFKGWIKTVVDEESGELLFTADFEQKVNQYTIKFVNWDGSAIEGLADLTLDYGATITLPEGITPTRPNSATCGYVFDKWSPDLTAETKVTGDATYTAQYTETAEFQYAYTFYDEDGTPIKTASINASASVVAPADPTKAATAQYSYTFDGWYTAATGGEKVTVFGAISADTAYYARYTSTVNQYTISFVDEAGNPITGIAAQTADYGTAITIPGAPTKAADAVGTYKFDGWYLDTVKLEAGATITGNATYKAQFSVDVYTNYTVTFVNGAGEFDKKTDYHYGDTITAPATDPTKAEDAQYTYSFAGWFTAAEGGEKVTDFGTVSGNVTYYAQFTYETRTYEITFLDKNGGVLKREQVAYGTMPTAPAVPNITEGLTDYSFKAWDTDLEAVTGAKTYTATYNELSWTKVETLVAGEGTTSATFTHSDLAGCTSATVTINGVTKENVSVASGAIALNLADYGVTEMGQYSAKIVTDGGDHLAFTDVWYVTQVIDNVAELKALGAACKAANTTGFYILGGDIDCSAEANMATGNPGWQANGFSGTFDGRGKTISNIKMMYEASGGGYGGLFGNLAGCTIQNVVFDKVNYSSVNAALLGRHSYASGGRNVNINNITVNVSGWGATGEAGLFVSRGTLNTLHNNCTVNIADGLTIHNLLGQEWKSNYGTGITVNLGVGSSITSYYYQDTATAQTTPPSIMTVNTIVAEEVNTLVAGENSTSVTFAHADFADNGYATVKINGVTKNDVPVTSGAITLDLADYDVTTMGQYAAVITTDGGNRYTFTDVWYVTQVINDATELKALGAACNSDKVSGYYILGNDINFENATVTGACPGWRTKGFGGTFDGRNCTISNLTVSTRGGLFGNLAACTIKNMTFDNIIYAEGGSLFGGHSGGQGDGNTTLENITVNVAGCTATSEVGIFCSRSTLNTIYNNCVVNIADNVTFINLLGTEWSSPNGTGIAVNLGEGSSITYYYAETTTAPAIVTVKTK